MKLLTTLSFALLLLLPLVVVFDGKTFAYASEEDAVDGEDGEVNVEGEIGKLEEEEVESSIPEGFKTTEDLDIKVLFTKPIGNGLELPVGKDVSFLVGVYNKGQKEYLLSNIDASIRYSQDFSFHLQNFTTYSYNRLVKPKQEATLAYQFYLSDAYTPRPYGLTVNLYYQDAEKNNYFNKVFNETISIVELDEGLDGETFFLFIVLGALGALGLVGLYQLLQSFGKKHISSGSRSKVETGTSNHDDVDYDWIPAETIKHLNKSPNPAKTSSPRQRRQKAE